MATFGQVGAFKEGQAVCRKARTVFDSEDAGKKCAVFLSTIGPPEVPILHKILAAKRNCGYVHVRISCDSPMV